VLRSNFTSTEWRIHACNICDMRQPATELHV
jgi:hypothetical protein